MSSSIKSRAKKKNNNNERGQYWGEEAWSLTYIPVYSVVAKLVTVPHS